MVRRRRRKAKDRAGERPLSNEVWEVDVFTLHDIVQEDAPELAGARVGLVVDDDTGAVVGTAVEPRGDDASSIADLVLDAIRSPMVGHPRRPAAVRVRQSDAARKLASKLPRGTDIEFADSLPAVDAALAAIREAMLADAAGIGDEPISPAALGDVFDAAATYYEAAPWLVVPEDAVLELSIGDGAPAYATVIHARHDGLPGFALHDSLQQLLEVAAGRSSDADVTLLFFASDAILPREMLEERREHGWRLAGPAAFPMLSRHTADGGELPVDVPEMARVSAAMRALAALVAADDVAPTTQRTFTVNAVDGTRTEVSIARAPLPRAADADELDILAPRTAANLDLFDPGEGTADDEVEAVFDAVIEVADRISALPDTAPIMARLAWSFFRAPAPLHVGDEEYHIDEAMARFAEWVYFAARPGPGQATLVEQALDAAQGAVPPARLTEMREAARPRHSIYRVTRAKPGALDLHDVLRNEPLTVMLEDEDPVFESAETFVGNLFPRADGSWALGSSTIRVEGTVAEDAEPSDPETAALDAETFLGASCDWIGEIPTVGALRDAWSSFRDDLGQTGMRLPTFGELQRIVREADSPAAAIESVARQPWWSLQELEVCAAFLLQTWQLTPRVELGDVSPSLCD